MSCGVQLELSTFSTMKANATPPKQSAHQAERNVKGDVWFDRFDRLAGLINNIYVAGLQACHNAGLFQFLEQAIVEVAAGLDIAAQALWRIEWRLR